MGDGLSVAGGAGGHVARTEDLTHAARALAAAADDVRRAGAICAATASGLHATATLPPIHAEAAAVADAVAALDWVGSGQGGTAAVAAHLDRLVDSMRETVSALEDAEWRARLDSAALHLPVSFGLVPGLGFLSLSPTDIVNRDTVQGTLAAVPGLFGPAFGLLSRVSGVTFPEALATWITGLAPRPDATLDNAAGLWVGPTEVHAVGAPNSVEDAFERVVRISPAEGGPAQQISIERIDNADRTTAWIVSIPGTQNWFDWVDGLFSGLGNLQGLAGMVTDVQAGVAEAMTQAGVAPDDPVMLVGHSQGGLLAASLATMPAFTERYNVTALLTGGAPIGGVAIPPEVAVLSLENGTDLVPGLDGAPNPEWPNWVTVTRDLYASGNPEDRGDAGSIGGSHAASTYARTAAAVDASNDVSIAAWKESAAPFLAGTAVTSVITNYGIVARPDSPPASTVTGRQTAAAGAKVSEGTRTSDAPRSSRRGTP